MANGGESFRGALGEAALPVGIAVSSTGERSESPIRQAIRRLRKSTTAVIGVVIVVGLLLVPFSRTSSRRRARSPTTRPRPSRARAGTIRSGPTSSAATC